MGENKNENCKSQKSNVTLPRRFYFKPQSAREETKRRKQERLMESYP